MDAKVKNAHTKILKNLKDITNKDREPTIVTYHEPLYDTVTTTGVAMLTREDLQELVEEARLQGIPWGQGCVWEIADTEQTVTLLLPAAVSLERRDEGLASPSALAESKQLLFLGMRWAALMRAAESRGFAAEECVDVLSDRGFQARARFFRLGDPAAAAPISHHQRLRFPICNLYEHYGKFESFLSRESLSALHFPGFFCFSRLLEKRAFAQWLEQSYRRVLLDREYIASLHKILQPRSSWGAFLTRQSVVNFTQKRSLEMFVNGEVNKLLGSSALVCLAEDGKRAPFETGRHLLDFWICAQQNHMGVGSYFHLTDEPEILLDLKNKLFGEQSAVTLRGVLRLGPAMSQKKSLAFLNKKITAPLVWNKAPQSDTFRTGDF